MAISWDTLNQKKKPKPPCILLYGPEKAGKTTLASEFPGAVYLQAEEGDGVLDIQSLGKIESYAELMDAIGMLYNNEHEFQTVVLDSITALQPLVWAETGARGDDKGAKKERIEDFGYGKGYLYALAVWQEILEGLNALRNERGMTIIMIAHSKIERFEDPETAGYNRYDIDLHDKAREYLKREADAILLLKPDVMVKSEDSGFNKTRAIAQGGRSVWVHATSRPAYAAGNRYGIPEKTLYESGKGYAALAPYFPHLAVPLAIAAE